MTGKARGKEEEEEVFSLCAILCPLCNLLIKSRIDYYQPYSQYQQYPTYIISFKYWLSLTKDNHTYNFYEGGSMRFSAQPV